MSEPRSPSNPPETVPWSEYRIMVDQRDSFREDMVRLRLERDAARAALQYLQHLIAEDDLPVSTFIPRPHEHLRECRERLRDEGYDPGPAPVEGVE